MIRRFCAYALEFKASDGFIPGWCTLIPALELEYNTSIHYPTGKTSSILKKRWNPKIPGDTLRKDLVDINKTSSSFELLVDKVRHHENQSMTYSFEYAKKSGIKVIRPLNSD
ncbi:hypothetical protein O181_000219 [Austropuccinia psidii MF-1]|uniref:Uncharacterized protein n=1 Tax=Austropuccinia psidii MF-1 TaxID=1389203 RepID=A0A9Q3B866_9BASI|nr:hypothetical protein [Austropuccinia psidii MF-1]